MHKSETIPAITRPALRPECQECRKLREQRFRLLTVVGILSTERDDLKRMLNATLAEKRRGDWQWWEWLLYVLLWAVMIVTLLRL